LDNGWSIHMTGDKNKFIKLNSLNRLVCELETEQVQMYKKKVIFGGKRKKKNGS